MASSVCSDTKEVNAGLKKLTLKYRKLSKNCSRAKGSEVLQQFMDAELSITGGPQSQQNMNNPGPSRIKSDIIDQQSQTSAKLKVIQTKNITNPRSHLHSLHAKLARCGQDKQKLQDEVERAIKEKLKIKIKVKAVVENSVTHSEGAGVC